jgi:CheY-like chemotaxis protein
MPKMSGVDFLNSLEAMLADASIRSFDEPPVVLVITATPPSDLPRSSLQDRYPQLVRGVFRKPLDLPELGKTVKTHLAR